MPILNKTHLEEIRMSLLVARGEVDLHKQCEESRIREMRWRFLPLYRHEASRSWMTAMRMRIKEKTK